MMNELTIGIIGGNGSMGSLFARELLNECKEVIISDCNTKLSNRELVKIADLIIIAVPIEETVKVIEEILPEVSEDKLLMDVTSLKCKPIEFMLHSKADIIGMHPMFDPSVGSLEKQTIILSPVRDRRNWLSKITSFLNTKKANFKIISPEKHDKLMSVIQSLIHFNLISIGMTLARNGFEINELLEFASPLQRITLSTVARILDQNYGLYGNILLENSYNQQMLVDHKQSIEDLMTIIQTQDMEKFVSIFEKASDYFADFKSRATTESNFLINELVNFNANR